MEHCPIPPLSLLSPTLSPAACSHPISPAHHSHSSKSRRQITSLHSQTTFMASRVPRPLGKHRSFPSLSAPPRLTCRSAATTIFRLRFRKHFFFSLCLPKRMLFLAALTPNEWLNAAAIFRSPWADNIRWMGRAAKHKATWAIRLVAKAVATHASMMDLQRYSLPYKCQARASIERRLHRM